MGIVHKFERHKYSLPAVGDGIFDGVISGVKGAVDLATKNKDLISSVGKSVGAVAGAAGKISDAVKAAQRFNELKELQRIKQVQQTQPATQKANLPADVKQAIQSISSRNKAGDGFAKF